jgi:hypothetical protein
MERIFIGRHDAMNPAGRGRLPGELRKPGEAFRCPAVRRDHRALKQSISVPVLSSRQLSFEAAGLNSMEFPVAKPRNIDAGRNGRLSRIGWSSIS